MFRYAATAVFALLAAAAANAGPPSYTVSIQEGLKPRMSPSAVAGLASATPVGRAAVGGVRTEQEAGEGGAEAPGAKVVTVECIDGQEIRSAFSHPSMHSDAPLWIVRLEGKFIDPRSHAATSKTRTKAYYVVDDATGEIIAFGTSGSGPGTSGNSLDRLIRGR